MSGSGPGGGRDLGADEADLLTTTEASGRLEQEAATIRRRLAAASASPGTPESPAITAERARLAELEAAMARYGPRR